MSPLKFEGQIKRFDVTIPRDKYESWEDLHKKLVGWCSHFAYQLEKGESGYEHWQCRVQMIHKRTCKALLTDVVPAIGGHWSVTSNGVHNGPKAFTYVMKEDTRLDGPWDDTSLVTEKPPLTRQLQRFMEHDFYPWQDKCYKLVQEEDDRWIHLVFDEIGNVGKSIFLEFLEFQGLAFEMPPLRHMEDIMEFAHSFPPQKAYIIDMPRGMKKDKLADFYAGLESIKNGVTYDKRYTGKKRRMDRPQVIVFTNTLPAFDLMSKDRWRIFVMQSNHSMDEFTPDQILRRGLLDRRLDDQFPDLREQALTAEPTLEPTAGHVPMIELAAVPETTAYVPVPPVVPDARPPAPAQHAPLQAPTTIDACRRALVAGGHSHRMPGSVQSLAFYQQLWRDCIGCFYTRK